MTPSTPPDSPWIRVHTRRPGATARLICLPHAGGAASFFRGWGQAAPPWLEVWAVQYPGREDRLAEDLIADIGPLADGVAGALAATAGDLPIALFGHSMGAAVAYETARRLLADPATAPTALYVSACPAPGPVTGKTRHLLGDDALAADLLAQGATSPAVLGDPELREIVLAIVRNDYRLIETYRRGPAAPLPVPITAFSAEDDDTVEAGRVAAWEADTSADFTLHRVPGDHFHLVPGREALIKVLAEDLTRRFT
ncbi:thioesterase II family protein [Spongiactinospora sp. 9N601]|uniref:thioesterase II family protein n=1 Tax=Spongiactinospora sp. 9N601 TaxID=3375149 RepID=UPI0037919A79